MIPVLAAPMIDPGRDRISTEVPEGLTIAEIVTRILPFPVDQRHVRVALVTPYGSQIVPREVWHRARPNAGVHVVIRVVPGKNALRAILQIVVSIAAVAIGAYFAPALAGALGISNTLAAGIIGLGVTVLGNLLINALIPLPKADNDQENRYSITGWRNRMDPDGAVPFLAGTMQIAPPFAALSWSEIVGDFLYIRSLFNFGYGEVRFDNFRIGETSLSEYDEVEIETRDGLDDDEPISFFPYQRAEESIGADLTYPYPRDDLGEIIDDSDPEETPVTRATGADASGASVIFAWPAGLFRTNSEGKVKSESVTIEIYQRLVQAEEWQAVTTLTIQSKQREAFYRQHTWTFAQRGRWQIRCIMKTPESTSIQRQRRTTWAVLQTIRPEYPLNFSSPLALVALRIKATYQLNGQLDNFNALASRICLDYDYTDGTWKKRSTSNPASIFRLVLQSDANPRPVDDDGIDLTLLQDWHDFCRVNDLKYDSFLNDASKSIGDTLTEIAAAGRATKRHDGTKWGVVIDRPQDMLVVTHLNPRNTYGFKASRSYYQKPDGFRVQFYDATNDYESAERLVPWPGNDGEIKLTESLELPGKTDPDEIYLEARRRMYEAIYRPDVYQISQDGPVSVTTRGDKVMLSQDVIDRVQVTARVRSAADHLVELDDVVTMDAALSYGIRFKVYQDEDDTIGTSVVRTVLTVPGETRLLTLLDDGDLPTAGSLCHFGISGSESFELIVSGIEAGEDLSCHLRLIDASPIIDELIAAEVVPTWSGRVGAEIAENTSRPPEPRFTSISSGVSGTDTSGLIDYLITPGSGAVETAEFVISHRLSGASAWSTVTIPAANGGGELSYTNGQTVQLKAWAVSPAGVAGPETAVITVTVGSEDAAIPAALDDTMITVGALLGGAVVQFSTSDDSATTHVQLYRSMTSTLDRETDAVGDPIATVSSRSYSQGVGDTTRENLLTNGAFDNAGTWTLGIGWSIASGVATHTTGSASTVSQAIAAVSGKYYRIGFEISGRSAGDVTPQLTGGSTRNGSARAANGSFVDRIQAVSGNATFGLIAASTFDGSIDNVVAFVETATCLDQGTHFFWLEPQNSDGVPGSVSGPFSVQIR